MNTLAILNVLPALMLLVKMTSVTRYIIVASLSLTVVLLCSAILLFHTVKRKEFKQCLHCKASLENGMYACPHCGGTTPLIGEGPQASLRGRPRGRLGRVGSGKGWMRGRPRGRLGKVGFIPPFLRTRFGATQGAGAIL